MPSRARVSRISCGSLSITVTMYKTPLDDNMSFACIECFVSPWQHCHRYHALDKMLLRPGNITDCLPSFTEFSSRAPGVLHITDAHPITDLRQEAVNRYAAPVAPCPRPRNVCPLHFLIWSGDIWRVEELRRAQSLMHLATNVPLHALQQCRASAWVAKICQESTAIRCLEVTEGCV